MTVQELRDLLAAYKDEQAEIEDSQRVEVWKVSLGAAQATLSGAAIEALPALLDVADALATILHRVETRRTGIHIDGTEEWPTPLHKEVAQLARDSLKQLKNT